VPIPGIGKIKNFQEFKISISGIITVVYENSSVVPVATALLPVNMLQANISLPDKNISPSVFTGYIQILLKLEKQNFILNR